MTYDELVKAAAETAGITQRQARAVLDVVVDMLSLWVLEGGERFRWPGLGSFVARQRKASRVRVPGGGEHEVAPQTALRFRPAAAQRMKHREAMGASHNEEQ